ncbi:MAG: AAA family ATPase [Candidatus Rokubacteria bacterium]|nr:AAA family ATPase [Candidatus Rokubacteria bacterium]
MDFTKDLELLIRSRYPIIAVETYEEERLEQALQRLAAKLGIPLFVWTITEGLRRHGADNAIYDSQLPIKALGNLAAIKGDGLYLFKDLHRHLGEADVARKLQDLARSFAKDRRAVVLSAARVTLPAELEKFAAFFRLDLPGVEELKGLVKRVVRDLSRQHTIAVDLSPEEFDLLAASLKGFTLFEAERAVTRAILQDLALTRKDLELITEIKKGLLEKEGLLEYVPPEEDLAQIGGLRNLKQWLEKRRKALEPEARQFGIEPPRGILLLGVQGSGKSLVAKAVAKAWGLPFLRLEPGRLYDKYVGESEKNLDKALRMAERMAPCVLMIDEIEKGLAYVGSSEADAGLSKRIFARLLGWFQDRKAPVFVVATCNQLSQLPPELMRKGRFDEIFFIDLPNREERGEIFAVHLKKRNRDPSAFDLDALADASEGYSGAEIEQAIVSALYTAFSHGTELSTRFLLEELAATKPLAVTRKEEIAALREWARERTVMAS